MRLSFAPARPAEPGEVEAVLDCLRSGWLTMGPRVQALEERFVAVTGLSHGVAVTGEALAMRLALAAVGVGPGDRVLVPGVGGAAAASAAAALGAHAEACDVLAPELPLLDPREVLERIAGARAVVAVALGGASTDVAGLRAACRDHGVALVEDATSALGVPGAGAQADVAVFSLGAGREVDVGTGGVVAARTGSVASRLRLLRSHGLTSTTWDRHRGHATGYDVVAIGWNARLDEIRAALALSRLERLPAELELRGAVLRRYRDALADADRVAVCFPEVEGPGVLHGNLLVLVPDPGRVARALAAEGIEVRRVPGLGSLPRAGEVAERGLELPVAGLRPGDAEEVATRLREAAAE